MKILAFETQNENFLVNIDNIVFFYTDKNKEEILKEISLEEFQFAQATWAARSWELELDIKDFSQDVEDFINSRYSAYKLKVERFYEKLEEVDFLSSNFYEIITRREATFSTHDYSHAVPGLPINLSDKKIYNLFKRFLNKEMYIEEILSDIKWIESGNCVGDGLYPVILKATLLGSGNYFIEINHGENCSGYTTDTYLYKIS